METFSSTALFVIFFTKNVKIPVSISCNQLYNLRVILYYTYEIMYVLFNYFMEIYIYEKSYSALVPIKNIYIIIIFHGFLHVPHRIVLI